MALSLTIGGDDVTGLTRFSSIGIEDSREVKGDTFNFELWAYDDAYRLDPGKEVIFSDGSSREFGGVIVDVGHQIGEGNRLVKYIVQCMDYTYLFDRRVLNKLYASDNADDMVVQIITDLKDFDTGDDHYGDFFTNISRPAKIQGGPVIRQQVFQRIYPSQAIDQIAQSSGMAWWVDFNKAVNLVEIDFNVAPIDPLVLDSNVSFYNLRLEKSILGVGTRPIIRDAVIKSTSTITENFIWNTGDSLSLTLAHRPFSELDIVSVKKNGTLQTQQLEHINRELSDDSSVADTVFVFVGPVGQNRAHVRFPSGNISNGDTVEIIYNYGVVDDHEGFGPEGQAMMAALTSGGGKSANGIHDFVFSQASEIAAVSAADLDYITDVLVDNKAKMFIRGEFSTQTKGYQAGQAFELTWNRIGLNEKVYVVTVRKTILTPADATAAPILESRVQFSNIPRGMRT
tara:strand:+ start:2287 stop:3654 length:1368 start_codon:yes stop_codon:yes gene_type:complete